MFLVFLFSVGILLNTVKAVSEATSNSEPITESLEYVYEQPYANIPKTLCNCVKYAEEVLGITYLGIAKDIKVSKHFNRSVKMVVTNEGQYGHVALILKMKDGLLYLKEANYHHCQESERTLPIDSPKIIGYK